MKKTLRILAVSAASALALTGCMKMQMDFEVHSDDTMSGSVIVAMDKELIEATGQSADDVVDQMTAEIGDDASSSEPYDDGTFVGAKMTFDAEPLGEFDGAEGLNITREGDDFVLSGDTSSITEGSGTSTDELTGTGAEMTMSFTFPGPVSEASDGAQIDGNTVTWDLLTSSGEISARASATESGGGFPVWIIVVIGLVVGVGIGAAIFVAARNKPSADAEGAPADATVFDPAAGTIPPAVPGAPAVPADPAAPTEFAPPAGEPAPPAPPAPAAEAPVADEAPAAEGDAPTEGEEPKNS